MLASDGTAFPIPDGPDRPSLHRTRIGERPMNSEQIDVYPFVVEGFEALGAKYSSAITRNVLLRDRYYAGQRFFCEDLTALVLAGAQELAFHNASGEFLSRVPLVGHEPLRKVV
jgi:hypothetical protein